MSKHFSVEGAEERIISALGAKEELEKIGVDLVEALRINHVAMQWIIGQKPDLCERIARAEAATSENISALDGLWDMCARHGIHLDEAQKIELYQDFLDD